MVISSLCPVFVPRGELVYCPSLSLSRQDSRSHIEIVIGTHLRPFDLLDSHQVEKVKDANRRHVVNHCQEEILNVDVEGVKECVVLDKEADYGESDIHSCPEEREARYHIDH